MQLNRENISTKRKIRLILGCGDKQYESLFTHYFNTHINQKQRNPKQLWNSLREISGTSVSSNIPHLNDAEGNLITSYSKTADMFNTHFFNIYIGQVHFFKLYKQPRLHNTG